LTTTHRSSASTTPDALPWLDAIEEGRGDGRAQVGRAEAVDDAGDLVGIGGAVDVTLGIYTAILKRYYSHRMTSRDRL